MLLTNQTAGFFKMKYLKGEVKKWSLFLTCWETSKFSTSWSYHILICSQAYPKYPNCKVYISLQYLQKNMWDETFFFCLQINTEGDSIIFDVHNQAPSKYPKLHVCNIFEIISLKTGRMKLIFCLQKNIKNFFKLILSF